MKKLLIALIVPAIIMSSLAHAEASFHDYGGTWAVQDEYGSIIEAGSTGGSDAPHSMYEYEMQKQNAREDLRAQQASDQPRDALQDMSRR